MSTVAKAIDLLFFLRSSPQPSGPSEIGRALGLPKASVHRLLGSLAHRRLVERGPDGRYRLGLGLVELGSGPSGHAPLVRAARGPMERACAELGETFFLVVAQSGELTVASIAEGTGFLRASPGVGARIPAHATAVGRLFLAFAPELVSAPPARPEAFTDATLRSAAALRRAVDQARAAGYAVSRDEWQSGLSAVAAPVRGAGGAFAAVAVACASARLEQLGEASAARAVLRVAAEILSAP